MGLRNLTYIVLAAGAATRMGFPKPFASLAGRSPLARIVDVLGDRPVVVVAPSEQLAVAATTAPHVRVVANDEPGRGMAHSVRIGLRELPAGSDFAIVLGDMPFLSRRTLEALEPALTRGVDVAYPTGEDGRPGHPVLFSARARAVVEALPDGDTLRFARDDATLVRATVATDDRGAFLDLDVPEQWAAVADA